MKMPIAVKGSKLICNVSLARFKRRATAVLS